MIDKLLRKNISIWQIAGYASAYLAGLVIVMVAVRFFGDVSSAFEPSAGDTPSMINTDFMVVSKRVSLGNTFGGASSAFSPAENASIEEQPWVDAVGEFAAANFSVTASVDFMGRGMSTFMFLEAIPDDFLDITPRNWGFDPANPGEIPIILSKDYLALYNFGFAATRGLPQITEGMVSQVPITLTVSGNGLRDSFTARIAGFSSRLNTIAVPADFLTWANARYGHDDAAGPSRLILKVSDPGNPEIAAFLDANGYEVAGDKTDSSRARYFLTVITSIVIAIGTVITALALLILMLSIYLLIQKNRATLRDLMLLGYSPAQVGNVYRRLILVVNGAVLLVAIAISFAAAAWWHSRLDGLGIVAASPLPSIAAGVALAVAVSAVAIIAIRRSTRRIFLKS